MKFLTQFILGYYETFGLPARLKFGTRPEVRIGSEMRSGIAPRARYAGALEATGIDR